MSTINLKNNILATIGSKGLILLLNFGVVIFTAQLWGAEGRGIIALFIADLSLISIFTNIFTGSSVSFYLSKFGASKLATQGYLWTFIVSAVAGVIVLLTGNSQIALYLFIGAALSGFIAFHNSLFLGGQKISYYNIITVIQPALLLGFMVGVHFIFPSLKQNAYFLAVILSYSVVLIVCRMMTGKTTGKLTPSLDKETIKKSFAFGWQTELSNLLQFFNYRLSYYLLNLFIGTTSVGIFSIGVTISEAIWIISKSISLVQYSNVIKQGDTTDSRKETITVSKYSFYITILCLLILFCLPKELFGFIFGAEFTDVKKILILLAPGILTISVSNVIGNYFSAIGKLKILIIKSGIGLLATIVLSFLLIPRLEITGACIVNSSAYIISSCVLFIWFYRKAASCNKAIN